MYVNICKNTGATIFHALRIQRLHHFVYIHINLQKNLKNDDPPIQRSIPTRPSHRSLRRYWILAFPQPGKLNFSRSWVGFFDKSPESLSKMGQIISKHI